MTDRERVPIEHDLPPDLRDALGVSSQQVGGLYNDLQNLDDETFADRFAGSLATLRETLDGTGHEFVVCALGIGLEPDPEDPVAGAALASVHAPADDGSVDDLLYVGEAVPTDQFVALPLRPHDCPPGSGQPASDLSVGEYREVVSAMVYKGFDLMQNDLDSYTAAYLRPLVRGLEAYADANRAE
jgi:hypothetical protein